MLAPVVHILPLTTLRRERLLPVPGRVTARMDQKVSALDVVAEAHYGQEHLLIDVARTLGVQPDVAQRLIRVRAGETITRGQNLAQMAGIAQRNLPAPENGRVILVGSGRILMEIGEGTFELRTGIPGKVSRLVPERGVEITFNGVLVQGVWGNAQMGAGMMMPLVTTADGLLTENQIDVSLRGSILLAGYCSDPQALQAAASLPVRGLILGSISPVLVPLASKMQYPIVVVDGFESKSMDGAAFRLLTTNAKREVTLNAEPFNRHTGVRPEILIPLPVAQEPPLPREVETFAPDQPVRLTRAPCPGVIGTLSRLLPGLTALPSGLRLAVAEVRLESGEQVIIPLANMEILG